MERWSTHKECIARAAAHVRELLFLGKIDGASAAAKNEVKKMAMAHIAKVVWNNDTRRARVLLNRCPITRAYVNIDLQGKVRLTDPALFAAD